ncbi:MAG: YgiQ family radical SAM protein [Bacteroidales bacterium]
MTKTEKPYPNPGAWLPITREELKKRGWDEVDVILVSGDAYVDHPSFGTAIIGRVIEAEGLRVAILPQPNWRDDLRDFKKLGKPRLFFGVTAGNMDSMVNHYTAAKRLRSDDAYTPGGKAGFRPDYASVVYCRILKNLYPDTPIVLGGVEASMRRFTHYDYWQDMVKPSILFESGADILLYGMAEKPLKTMLQRLRNGESISRMTDLEQSSWISPTKEQIPENKAYKTTELPSHDEMVRDKAVFAKVARTLDIEHSIVNPSRIIQENDQGWLVVNPPATIPVEQEMDKIYSLPFTRLPHPKYKKRGIIPAWEMIKDSITTHRGCYGGCTFCAISAHQGKFISNRSEGSVLQEIEKITAMPDFKGHITDLGGPTANMYQMTAIDFEICKKCNRPSCIYPRICKNLNTNHKPLIELYRKARKIKGVKKVTIGSGIRYDMFMTSEGSENKQKGHKEYFEELVVHHVSGRLKVAPEHTSDNVLSYMRKPSFALFENLKKDFDRICRQQNLNQQIIPYFISSHPGSEEKDMAELAEKIRLMGLRPEQVQDFTPTPGTLATAMFYTGLDPYSLKPVKVARSPEEKAAQKDFFFWYKPKKQKSRSGKNQTKRKKNH